MTPGYDRPLYLLPFDHRNSYVHELFGFDPPLSTEQADAVRDSKQVIYEGFTNALGAGVPTAAAGILVDEAFGASILRDARRREVVTAMSTERSGSDEFDFEYGNDFAAHLDAFDPTFAKALVRFNPEGDTALNARQSGRLRTLSETCRRTGRRFMFELLVPATKPQLATLAGDNDAYDARLRPGLMNEAIRQLQDAGVEPDVWKIEGLAERAHCEEVVATARRGGRDGVACIVLGRGANEAAVRQWLEVAASVPGFIGFAVGRTSFWDAVVDFHKGTTTRADAAARIAQRFREWIDIFGRGAAARGAA